MTTLPRGFRSHVANIGVKDDTDDFVVIAADARRARGRGVHQEPVRRAERHAEPGQRRRRHGPRGGGHLEERQRGHRARRATTTPSRSPARSPPASGASRPTWSSPRPASSAVATRSTGSAPASRRCPSELTSRRCRWPGPRDDDHRHGPQARRGHRRREHRPCRRDGEGRRDDRARHGDPHLAAVHRRRAVVDRPRRRVPAGGRPDVQLRERRHRHLDERLVGDHGVGCRRPGRRSTRSRRRCTRWRSI